MSNQLQQWTDPSTNRVWDRGPEEGQVVSDAQTGRCVFRRANNGIEWRFRESTEWKVCRNAWAIDSQSAIDVLWPIQQANKIAHTLDAPKARTAASFLDAALGHMKDRTTTYDRPQGERSMGNCVEAFNKITGHQLTEEQGWLFMVLLKIVRTQQGAFRADNYEDMAAYAGLAGESAAKARG